MAEKEGDDISSNVVMKRIKLFEQENVCRQPMRSETDMAESSLPKRDSGFVSARRQKFQGKDDKQRSTLQRVCPQVQGVKEKAEGQNVFAITWKKCSGAERYKIVYIKNGGMPITEVVFDNHCTLTNLEYGETYQVTIQPLNQAGLGKESDPVIIQTGCSQPQELKIEPLARDEINLTWEKSSGTEKYMVEYRTKGDASPIRETAWSNQCILHNLKLGRTYRITVIVLNRAGVSVESDPERFKTVCDQVREINTEVVGPNSCVVIWEESRGAEEYKIIYKRGGGRPETTKSKLNRCTLRNLEFDKNYQVSICPWNKAGLGRESDPAKFTTGSEPKVMVVRDVKLVNSVTNPTTSVKVQFTASEPKSSAYRIVVSPTSGSGNEQTKITKYNKSRITGLSPGTEYVAHIACVEKGQEDHNEAITSNRVLTGCAQVEGLKTERETPNEVKVTWDKSCGAEKYKVLYQKTKTTNMSAERVVMSNMCILANLEPDETYQVTVFPWNKVGFGEESDPMTFKTKPGLMTVNDVQLINNETDMFTSVKVQFIEPKVKPSGYKVKVVPTSGKANQQSIVTKRNNCVITGLTSGTEYISYVTCIDDGRLEFKDEAIPSNSVFTGCSKVTRLKAIAAAPDKFRLTWEKSTGAEKYKVVYSIINGGSPVEKYVGSNRCTLRNLALGETYQVTVLPLNRVEVGDESAPITFKTACARVEGLKTEAVDPDKFKVIWNKSRGAEKYQVKYQSMTRTGVSAEKLVKSNMCIMENLEPDETYQVTVFPWNQFGFGEEPEAVIFNTEPAFITVSDVQLMNSETDPFCSVKVQFIEPKAKPTGYKVKVVPTSGNGKQQSVVTKQNKCVITGLTSGIEYIAYVTCENDGRVSFQNKAISSNSIFTGCSQVRGLKTTPVAPDKVKLIWEKSRGAEKYKVLYSIKNGGVPVEESVETNQCTLRNLVLGETYRVTVLPLNQVGVGVESDPVTFKTGRKRWGSVTSFRSLQPVAECPPAHESSIDEQRGFFPFRINQENNTEGRERSVSNAELCSTISAAELHGSSIASIDRESQTEKSDISSLTTTARDIEHVEFADQAEYPAGANQSFPPEFIKVSNTFTVKPVKSNESTKRRYVSAPTYCTSHTSGTPAKLMQFTGQKWKAVDDVLIVGQVACFEATVNEVYALALVARDAPSPSSAIRYHLVCRMKFSVERDIQIEISGDDSLSHIKAADLGTTEQRFYGKINEEFNIKITSGSYVISELRFTIHSQFRGVVKSVAADWQAITEPGNHVVCTIYKNETVINQAYLKKTQNNDFFSENLKLIKHGDMEIWYDPNKPLRYGSNVFATERKGADGVEELVLKIVPGITETNRREVKNLKMVMRHENIVKYYASGFCEFRGSEAIYLLMERCDQDTVWERFYSEKQLKDSMRRKPVAYTKCKFEMRSIGEGIQYIHQRRIVHRDLKPHNILIRDGVLVISDFGLSKRLPTSKSITSQSQTDIGTNGWRAPETGHDNAKTTKASDVYSYGLVSHYMLTNGKHPYGGDPHKWHTYIVDDVDGSKMCLDGLDSLPDAPLSKDLIRSMLARKLEQRPTIAEVLSHPFFWDDRRKFEFISDVCKYLELVTALRKKEAETDEGSLLCLSLDGNDGKYAKEVDMTNWKEKLILHEEELRELRNKAVVSNEEDIQKDCIQKKVNKKARDCVSDAIKFIRNRYTHDHEDKSENIDMTNEELWEFFNKRFPYLFLFVYHKMKVYFNGKSKDDKDFTSTMARHFPQ